MSLTPEEILNHEFTKKGSRAYIASEVDAFLDKVNDDYQTTIFERNKLAHENEQLQAKVDELEAKREQVTQSIVVAQEAADRLKKDADIEVKKQLTHAQEAATKIISDAKSKAEYEASYLAQENADLVEEQNDLRQKVLEFKNSFLNLLELQRKLLENDELAKAIVKLPLGKTSAERLARDNEIETEVVMPEQTVEIDGTNQPHNVENESDDPDQGPVIVLPD